MTPVERPGGRLPRAERRDRAASAFVFAALLVAAMLLPPLRPLPFDACVLHRLTGLPCLTCGLTRSICLLVQGRWLDAIAMHPAAPIAVVLIASACLWLGTEAAFGRSLRPRLRGRLLLALVGAGFALSAAAWVLRIGALVHQRW
jgi:hypothetical protein